MLPLDLNTLRGKPQPPTKDWSLFGSAEVFEGIPENLKAQILFLDRTSTQIAYEAFSQGDWLCGDDGWGNSLFSAGCFASVITCNTKIDSDWLQWLHQREVAVTDRALLLPVFGAADEPAILTTWAIVLEFATELLSGDNLVIVDAVGIFSRSVNWCFYYHHDGVITFAKQSTASR